MAFDSLAPTIRIQVEGIDLDVEVTQYVTKCVVELTVDMADKITLTVLNPQTNTLGSGYTGAFAFTDSKVFQPGNTILVYMGYGANEALVGAGVIQKYLPRFPQDGPAMLTIMAYDGSVLMMDGETSREGRVWENTAHEDVVIEVVNDYNFAGDVAVGTATEKNTTKKRGMSDWELVSGLARLHNFDCKVVWDEGSGLWKLHWGTPFWVQDKTYTFTYIVNGQDSTLLSFEPEMAITGQPSTVQVLYWDQDTRTWEKVEIKEDKEGESIKFTGSGALEDEITSSTQYRLSASGIAVDVIPGVHFDTAEDAQLFAERFFRARKDQFITARGKCIGLETLKAGHIHTIAGVGTQLSGDYEFTTVRHVFDAQSGYVCEFFAHKVLD